MGVAAKAPSEPVDASGRGRNTSTDKREMQPRVPLIGVDSGAIPGTKPGEWMGQAAELERAGRDIVRARLHRNRFKPV